ncbi:PREDICTED: protein HEXIM1 [Nipponia nippon]|nr:PREDICTED: protein HEXIM1 [Nipponia nippon]
MVTAGRRERTANPSQEDPASSPAPERPEDAQPGEQRNGQHVPGGGLAPAAEALEGSQVPSDSEGDVYCDTLEQMEPEQADLCSVSSPSSARHRGTATLPLGTAILAARLVPVTKARLRSPRCGPAPPTAPSFRRRGTGGLPALSELGCHRQRSALEVLRRGSADPAGQPLGLSPNGLQAGPEPLPPRGAGQGERGEGRRLEGRSSAGLAALGSQRDLQLAGAEQDAGSVSELALELPAELDARVASAVRALQDDMRGRRQHRHLQLAGAEQDAGSVSELALELPAELDARVASAVRALQDDMRQVLERLSQLETLASAQGDAAGTDPGWPLAPQGAAKSEDTSEEDFLEEAAEEDGGSDGMGGDGSEFLQRDFSETYERYHVESLQNMSKQELVKEYLELEKCLSRMEEENNRLRMESKKHGGEAAETRVRQLQLEVDRLRAENLRLLKERAPPGREQSPCPAGGAQVGQRKSGPKHVKKAGRSQPCSIATPLHVPRQAIAVSYSCPRRPRLRQSISQPGRTRRADGITEPGASTASLAHGAPAGTPSHGTPILWLCPASGKVTGTGEQRGRGGPATALALGTFVTDTLPAAVDFVPSTGAAAVTCLPALTEPHIACKTWLRTAGSTRVTSPPLGVMR